MQHSQKRHICKLWILPAWCNLPTSCIKPVDFIKLRQVSMWTSDLLQSWYLHADLLQVDETTCIKRACSSQLATSLLTTCNRLVIIKPKQAMRTHPDIGWFIADLLHLARFWLCNSEWKLPCTYKQIWPTYIHRQHWKPSSQLKICHDSEYMISVCHSSFASRNYVLLDDCICTYISATASSIMKKYNILCNSNGYSLCNYNNMHVGNCAKLG